VGHEAFIEKLVFLSRLGSLTIWLVFLVMFSLKGSVGELMVSRPSLETATASDPESFVERLEWEACKGIRIAKAWTLERW